MPTIHDPATLPGALFYGALLLGAALLATRAIRLVVAQLLAHREHAGLDRTGVPFFSQFAQALIYSGALAAWAYAVPPLHHLGTAILAGVSVASVVLGLAAQSTLGNLIAGFAILLYRPIRLGDRVQVAVPGGAGVGAVEGLSLGYTIIRGDDGTRIIVPNSLMASQVTLNLNAVARPAPPPHVPGAR
jgi:small-conductance mechanosensitive channel